MHRIIIESPYFHDDKTFKMAVYMIIKANHAPKKMIWNGKYRYIERGQFITGRNVLVQILGFTAQEVRSRLKMFEDTEFITIETTNKFSLISINNYELYQGVEYDNQQINQPTTNQQPTNNQPITINKNDKNIKNEEKKETAAPTKPPPPAGCHLYKSKAKSPLVRACGLFKARSWCFQDKDKCQMWGLYNSAVAHLKEIGLVEIDKQYFGALTNQVKQGMDRDAERLSSWANKMHNGE